MRVSRFAVLLTVTAIAAMVGGCATMGERGPAAEEQIRAVLVNAFTALKKGDIEEAMAAVSEDFIDSRGADKSAIRLENERNIAQGLLAGVTFNLERCEIAVEGSNAVAKPVLFESYTGSSAHVFWMKKEADGVWRLIGMEQILPPDVNVWEAAATGNMMAIEQHVTAGTDVDAVDPATGSTPLNVAALLGQTGAAALLIDSGADVNARNSDGNTALHTAAFFGHTATVELLLEKGADANVQGQNLATPLDLVASTWNPDVEGLYRYVGGLLQLELDLGRIAAARPQITAILQKHSKISDTKDDIWSAAGGGDIEGIKRHMSIGTDLNATDPFLGNTPLHWAAIFGRTEAAGMLIEGGADVNVKGRDGSTPLHASVFFGHTEMVKLLLGNGADASALNGSWQTPLDMVAPPWSQELEGVYEYIGQTLRMELDLERIKAARPGIAELLREHDG